MPMHAPSSPSSPRLRQPRIGWRHTPEDGSTQQQNSSPGFVEAWPRPQLPFHNSRSLLCSFWFDWLSKILKRKSFLLASIRATPLLSGLSQIAVEKRTKQYEKRGISSLAGSEASEHQVQSEQKLGLYVAVGEDARDSAFPREILRRWCVLCSAWWRVGYGPQGHSRLIVKRQASSARFWPLQVLPNPLGRASG
jgi:hypothetical protein